MGEAERQSAKDLWMANMYRAATKFERGVTEDTRLAEFMRTLRDIRALPQADAR